MKIQYHQTHPLHETLTKPPNSLSYFALSYCLSASKSIKRYINSDSKQWSKHWDRNVNFTTNSLPPLKLGFTIAEQCQQIPIIQWEWWKPITWPQLWLRPIHRVHNIFARCRMLNRWFQNLPAPACLNSSHAIKKLSFSINLIWFMSTRSI